jgi:hypothetical protein
MSHRVGLKLNIISSTEIVQFTSLPQHFSLQIFLVEVVVTIVVVIAEI